MFLESGAQPLGLVIAHQATPKDHLTSFGPFKGFRCGKAKHDFTTRSTTEGTRRVSFGHGICLLAGCHTTNIRCKFDGEGLTGEMKIVAHYLVVPPAGFEPALTV